MAVPGLLGKVGKAAGSRLDVTGDKIRNLKTGNRVADAQLNSIADELDDGLSLREALREVEPDEDLVWDAINSTYPPQIKPITGKEYYYQIDEADPEDWGDDAVLLDLFKLNEEYKGKGLSRSALVQIISDIQEQYPGKRIVLDANPVGEGLNQRELVQLYRSVGFEPIDVEHAGYASEVPMEFEGFPSYISGQIDALKKQKSSTNYAAPATAVGAGGLLAAMTPDRAAQAAMAGQMSPAELMRQTGGFMQANQALRQAEQNRLMPAMRGEMSGPQTAIQRGAFDVGMAADRMGLGGTSGAYMNVAQGARPGLIDAILSGVELYDPIGSTQLGQGLLSR